MSHEWSPLCVSFATWSNSPILFKHFWRLQGWTGVTYPGCLTLSKIIYKLKLKIRHILPTSYFARVQEFINIARKSSSGRYQLRSYADFELSDFLANFVKPVISNLISEIENAFDIPEHLLGILAIDPQLWLAMP